MASIKKFQAHSVGRLFLHNNRKADDGVEHSNEDIDNSRTDNNYSFAFGTPQKLNKRLSEIFRTRVSDTDIVMAEVVVTLPQNVEEDSPDERKFFEGVYEFYVNDFGEDNVINAVVHKDEHRAHIHLDFVPTVTETSPHCQTGDMRYKANVQWLQEHGGKCERLCAKEAINRDYLQTMHERLNDFVAERLGYEAEILNGATVNGNKKVLQLKADTLKEQVLMYEQRLEMQRREFEEMHSTAKKWGIGENDIELTPLLQKIDDLETKNAVLQEIISRNGYQYTRPDLDKLRHKKFVPAQSTKVSVYDGSLVNADFEPNALIAIELPKTPDGKSPQQKLIDNNADLARQYKLTTFAPNQPVSIKTSKVNDQMYIFLRPDNERQTIEVILELERRLREVEDDLKGRRLHIDRIESDKFDFLKSVLNTLDIQSSYYARLDLSEKQGEEKTKEQQLV